MKGAEGERMREMDGRMEEEKRKRSEGGGRRENNNIRKSLNTGRTEEIGTDPLSPICGVSLLVAFFLEKPPAIIQFFLAAIPLWALVLKPLAWCLTLFD